jgi:hypothetical protein
MRTYISKEEQTTPGFQAAKNRETAMLGGNDNGDHKLMPVSICHAENPGELRGILKPSPPVYWRPTTKCWMPGPEFTEWFNDQLHRDLKAKCKAENTDFKTLLGLNNAPGHTPVIVTSKHTKVLLFPNKTPLLTE